MRSLPPGHSVVTIVWSPRPAANGVERHGEVPRVDAEARDRAAGANAAQAVLERLLLPERLDRDVGAAARESLDLGDDVLLLVS